MTIDREEIGRRLAAVMAYRGVSPGDLEGHSGVDRQTIWRYKKGISTQALVTMAVLADVLGARLDYIAYGRGPMFSGPNGTPED